ncbi:MAG: VOC family protein [Bifidobacteriaceae bacterium]|jgi:predicted enzyme related to lactoylglutathione lyase|nr:VOC family protein [Bifidobacteriaceae bacterium]
MEKLYTCYNCSFPFKADEGAVPATCPSCDASKDQYLSEPWLGDMGKRRLHVDPPEPEPDRDPMDTSYHHPKFFPARTRHGRIRRFVLPYDDFEESKAFYADVFGWDIVAVDDADSAAPLLFCATGPGNPNWEPSVPSFSYGYLRPRQSYAGGHDPRFVVEVDDIDATVAKAEEFGGSLVKGKYVEDGRLFAVIEDGEGNAFYLWQTPDSVTWEEPESQTLATTRRFAQVTRARDLAPR